MIRWLLRAKRWAQNPPSDKQVRWLLILIGICAAIYAWEYFIGLPDWMQVNNIRRHRF